MYSEPPLPLEFSSTPFTVNVEVDTKKYKICTVRDESVAMEVMANIARLLNENTGVSLTKPGTIWVGVQEADERHAMWSMFLSQRKTFA